MWITIPRNKNKTIKGIEEEVTDALSLTVPGVFVF